MPSVRFICMLAAMLVTGACTPGKESSEQQESSQQKEATLQFEGAVIRQPAPGLDKSVGYVSIANRTDKPITLVSAGSTVIGAIEIHETREVEGLMRMRRLMELSIGARDAAQLKPNGKHLMLFRLQPLRVGEQVEIVFTDTAGNQYAHAFDVVPLGYQP